MTNEGNELNRYLQEMKRIGKDLDKAMRAAAKDMDRLGRDALKDAENNAKLGAKEAEQALLRLEQDLKDGGPNIKKEMEDLQCRMTEMAARVEQEINRRIK